jgi:hypothetical protein
VQPEEPKADEEVVQTDETEEVVQPAEEATGEPEKEPEVSEEEVAAEPEEAVEDELDLESEDEEEVLQDEEEDLTPRDEEGKFTERFSNIDPKTLSPELQVVYKSMQADFTRKSQANAEKAGELEARMADYDEFLQDVSSTEGIVRLGVELAMRRPDDFNAMLEKVQRLSEHENERDLYMREQDLIARERQRERHDKAETARQTQEVVSYATGLARKAANQYGIPFRSVETYLDNAIAIHRSKNQGKVGKDDVKRILGEYVKPYAERKRTEARKKAKAKVDKAAVPAKPRPASGSAQPTSQPEPKKKFENLDEAVDDAIAREIAGLD